VPDIEPLRDTVEGESDKCPVGRFRFSGVPAGKIVHVILDNYAAHKHPKVRPWLERHPRWAFHFTPMSSSWLNVVEGSSRP